MGTTVNIKSHNICFRDTNDDHLIDLEKDVFTLEGEKISHNDPRLADLDQSLQKKLGVNLTNGLKVSTLQRYVNRLRRSEVETSANSPSDAHRVFGPLLEALEGYNEGIFVVNQEGDFVPGANDVSELQPTPPLLMGYGSTFGDVLTFSVTVPFTIVSRALRGAAEMVGVCRPSITEQEASEGYERREVAVQAFRDLIDAGISANNAWALEGRVEEALQKLPEDQQKILTQQLKLVQFAEIFRIKSRT